MNKIIFAFLAVVLLMPNSVVFARAETLQPHIVFTDKLSSSKKASRMLPMKQRSQTVLSFDMTLADAQHDANAHALFVQCAPNLLESKGKVRKSDLTRELILKDDSGKVIAKAPKGKPCNQENGRQFVFINQPIKLHPGEPVNLQVTYNMRGVKTPQLSFALIGGTFSGLDKEIRKMKSCRHPADAESFDTPEEDEYCENLQIWGHFKRQK